MAKAPPSTNCHLLHLTPHSAPLPSHLTGSRLAQQLSPQPDAISSPSSNSSFLLRQLLPPLPCWGVPKGQAILPHHLLLAFKTSFSDLTASPRICPPAPLACLGTPPAFSPGTHCLSPPLLSQALPSPVYCLRSHLATRLLSLGTLFAPSLQHHFLSPPPPPLPPPSRL